MTMFGGLGPNERIAVLIVRIYSRRDSGPGPGDESRSQQTSEDVQHDSEAVEFDLERRIEPTCHRIYCSPRIRQRIPDSRNPSMSPSRTVAGLFTSYSVRRSFTIWYGCNT